jgi:hypothetical protein
MQVRIGQPAYDAVTRARSGRIASAFARAANVVLDNGCVVALLAAGRPLHPWAIVPVDGISSLAVDMEVRIDAASLSVGPVAIALSRAEPVKLTIRVRPITRPSPTAARLHAWIAGSRTDRTSEELSAQKRIECGLDSLLSCGDAVHLASLVGLGPGLTPSCDDVLLGALAAFDCASAFEPEAGDLRQRLVCAIPRDLEQRTSLVSAQMLRAAVAGQYPEPVVNLAHALSESEVPGRDIRLATAEAQVRALGHRSGYDILHGFAAAMLAAAGFTRSLALRAPRSSGVPFRPG